MGVIFKSDCKLYLGDCLKVMPKLKPQSVDMVLTDLPYGTTQNSWDSIIPFDAWWSAVWRVCKPNAAVVLTAQCPFDKVLGASCIEHLKYEWVWAKENATGFLNADKQPLKNHENVLVFYRERCEYNPQMRAGFVPYIAKQGRRSTNYGYVEPNHVTESNGERFPLSIVSFQRDRNRFHPTQKPVALFEYLINTYTNPGQLVLDATMGSGTTGVACNNTGRNFIGIEINEEYFEVAKRRIGRHARVRVFA